MPAHGYGSHDLITSKEELRRWLRIGTAALGGLRTNTYGDVVGFDAAIFAHALLRRTLRRLETRHNTKHNERRG